MRAHAPGSVTTMFRPAEGGSDGVSLATADGVTATVEEATDRRILLDGEVVEFAPVEIALRELDVSAAVTLDTGLPIGCGFGISGAATLATALAVDAYFDLGEAREELIAIAHQAEVEAGTGLGDVFVQARGGLVWNLGEGIRSEQLDARLQYATYGDIETAAVLGDEKAIDRVTDAAGRHLPRFDPAAGIANLFDISWAFAEATKLPTPPVRDAVQGVRSNGGSATMAMVGETVIATEAYGMLEGSTAIATEGARVVV